MERLNEPFRSSTRRNSTSSMKRLGASTEAQSEVPASSAHESLHSIRRLLSKAIRSSQTAKETTTACIAIYDREGRRRLTLATKKAFPSFCPRSEIAFTRVIEMSPMTSAAEMLRAQGQALMKAARQSNVNQEMLQRLLQGSLAAGVNGGVPMLMRAFFPFAHEGANNSVPRHMADANASVVF